MKKEIKLFHPNFGKEEKKKIIETLESGFWASGSGQGQVKEFENRFQKFVKAKECVAVNSGTAALHLALSLYNIKDKEVIVPSLSFVSTAHAVVYNGGKPVFVDVDPETLCIDPKKVQEAVTKNTKGIIPVHFGGMPVRLDQISKIAKKYSLFIVDDAAHAIGTTFKNKHIGQFDHLTCFSFHPVKNLAMPTGGAITLDSKNKKFANELKSKRWCGISNRIGMNYDVDKLGWNFYMNEFSAAIGLVQLSKLDKLNKKRKKIAKRYSNEIKVENKMSYSEDCSYHLYWIRVKNRNQFIKKMKEHGIETGIHYKPIHKMSMYIQKKKLSITEQIAKEIVSIPIYSDLTENEIEKIINVVNKI